MSQVISETYSNYRSIPRISNSDLSQLRRAIFGIPEPTFHAAQDFGTRFHHYVLIDPNTEPTGKGATPMKRMITAIQNTTTINNLIVQGDKEVPRFWQDEKTGLACKAQLDCIIPDQRIILDIKTTSAKTLAEFEAACYRYDYDRQAAFYIDGCITNGNPIDTFIFVGVQKQKPHRVYVIDISHDSIFIDYGRKKYSALLRTWKKMDFQPSGWKQAKSAMYS